VPAAASFSRESAGSAIAQGMLAFRATSEEGESGVFTLAGDTLTRLVKDGDAFADPRDPDNTQFVLDFADLVALNDAGDVACSPGNLFDIDSKYGDVVTRQDAMQQLRHLAG